MVRELHQVATALAFDEEAVRVVVLKGEGAAFSAGFDGIQIKGADSVPNQDQDLINSLFARSFQSLPQPVIAMAHGFCGEASVALLELSDVAFAAHDCVFGRDSISAVEASDIGWITLDFPEEALEGETYKLAREWLQKDASALKLAKEGLRHIGSLTWDAVLSYTVGKQAELKVLQANSTSNRSQAVGRFLSGQTKPGLGN